MTPFRRLLLRVVRVLALSLIVSLALGVALLFFKQDTLIWHPAPYQPGRVEHFARPLMPLTFHTGQGNQTALYAPPRDGRGQPAMLWVLFAGNGSLALDWEDLVKADTDAGRAFLFVDYPGYGRCEGHASPATIRENADGALVVLEQTFPAASVPLGVMGHSIGTGAALEFTVRHPAVGRVVLVSPFTSLRDMARRVVGWPLNWLLRGNFRNFDRLDALATRPGGPPPVLVLHGDADSFIPPAMGRALAAAHPAFVRFEAVPGADHGDVLDLAAPRLLVALDGR